MTTILHPLGDLPKIRPSQQFRIRLLVILAPTILLAFTALYLAAAYNLLNLGNLDAAVSTIIRQDFSHRLSGDSDLLYSLGDLQIWDTVMLFVAVAIWLRRNRTEAILLGFGLSIDIAVELIKALESPLLVRGLSLVDLLAAANAGSFPSGHVARTSVSVALLVALYAWRDSQRRILAVALATGFLILMGAVSIKSGGHTLGEVLGGYILAALWIDVLLLIRELAVRHRTPASGRNDLTNSEDVPGAESD